DDSPWDTIPYHLESPNRLLFVYRIEDEKWIFFYQSTLDGRYFSAEVYHPKNHIIMDGIDLNITLITEEEVVAELILHQDHWIDDLCPDFNATIHKAMKLMNIVSTHQLVKTFAESANYHIHKNLSSPLN